MKIALYGNYNYHNFGDDLMAVLFGRFLQQCNVEFSVYKLRREYAEPYGFHVADSIEALLEGKDALIYGGGGILGDRAGMPAAYQADRCRLVEIARDRRMPIYGFSLGGDGRGPRPLVRFQELLLQAARCITVRNPDDVHWMKQINPNLRVDYYPDIVWQTSAFFPRQRVQHRRPAIGIYINASPLMKRRAIYVPALLSAIVRLRKDADFVLMDITGKKENVARLKKWFGQGDNVKYHSFHELGADLDILSSLDLLCCTKLHPGVACMSYGIPYISLFGLSNAKLALDNIRLSSLYYEHRNMPALCSLLMSSRKLDGFLDAFQPPDINDLQRESLGHFEALKRCIRN